MKKVKVALFLEPSVARDLKIQVASSGAKGLSAYVTQLVSERREPRIRKSRMAAQT